MELQHFEKILLAALRKFDGFLHDYNYSIVGMSYGDRDGDFIRYKSNNKNLEIHIVFTWVEEGISLDIIFYKNSLFHQKKNFNLHDAYSIFPELKSNEKIISEENYLSVIEYYFEVMKKYFVSVVKGEKWIDDFKKR